MDCHLYDANLCQRGTGRNWWQIELLTFHEQKDTLNLPEPEAHSFSVVIVAL